MAKNGSSQKINRREFVGGAAAASGLTIVPANVLGRGSQVSPSDKLNIAAIGAGGRAIDNLKGVESQNIVALCDVDRERAEGAFLRYPKAVLYKDFRVMLEKEKGIDAIVVSTPDHTHAVASIAAMRLGKHVYCEKPLSRTVFESRMMAKVAQESGVATQMGNQGMEFEGNRLLKDWLWDGAIGQVREVHAWSDRPTHEGQLFWQQGIKRPEETPPVPATLDWDLWLGPAPYRPYHPAYVPFVWRGWWDFGSGGLGDMGVHNLAPVFDTLKLTAPVAVHSSSTLPTEDALPLASIVHYEFPARGGMPPVTLHWYDGGLIPARPTELEPHRQLDREDGVILVGDRGTILIEGWGGRTPMLIPEARMRGYTQPKPTLPRSEGHYMEWIRACKENTQTASPFTFGGPLTEALLLGTISVRLGGQRLEWDSEKLEVTNVPEANEFLHYSYRPGWEL
ncbi:MAG: Gfo/Idh/MocA family oxidoreductase [Acidobacteriota bacterium]|nr:MAG: Gfo/Idh/MocA family oxidoreductase [Acidobacteriota bacterium]